MYLYSVSDEIQNLAGAAEFHLKGGCKVRVCSIQENPFLEFRGEVIRETENSLDVRMQVRNISNSSLYIDCLQPGSMEAVLGARTSLGIGIQAWTMLSGGIGAGVKDLCDLCFSQKVRDFYAMNYAMFGNRSNGKYFLCGFKSCKRQDTRIELHAEVVNAKFKTLLMCCDLAGYELKPGESLSSEILSLRVGPDPSALIVDFADELAQMYGPRRFRKISGWSGWDFYQRQITEQEMLQNVAFLAKHRDTLPIEYIQLDDGYEIRDGDWLLTNEKFPHGLKYLADQIHAAGFKAGLWVNPFLAAPDAQVMREHPDWAIKDKTGTPVVLNGYAVKEVYGLDCTVPGVTDYIRQLAHALTVDFGFDYLKLDGANRQVLTSLGFPANPAMGRGEAMRLGLEAFRSGMKPDAILLNGSIFGISMGISDVMRVGEDAGGRWDSTLIAKDHGERDRFCGPGEILRAISATNNHFYLHNKVWSNDPDYLVVRQEGMNSELSLEEARSWATVVAMSNGSIILADPPDRLTPERLEIVEKVLPHCPSPAHPVDFFRKNVPSILTMPASAAGEAYRVVSITNTDAPARLRDYAVDLPSLGLEIDTDYIAFEFWDSTPIGIVRNTLEIKTLKPHETKVISLHRKTGALQFIGTDSHISMGAIEVESFDGRRLGVRKRGRAWRAFFYLPEGMTPPAALNHLTGAFYSLEVPPHATLIDLETRNV